MKHLNARGLVAAAAALVTTLVVGPATQPAAASEGDYQLIEGTGSTWSQNAINQWVADVSSVGIEVAYGGGGSSKGRRDFGEGTVDFAITEIPYQGSDPRTGQSDSANGRDFAYMPVVAGGTSFMYHLEIGGKLYEGLRLSGPTVTKIFTGQITSWDDPAITKDNNGFALPATRIIPVVRSDGSGTTAQFTAWMDDQYASDWRSYCDCSGLTSYYPIGDGFVAKDGSVGVAGHISASYGNGTIGYVEYSYALNDNYPVAKVLNNAGYYVQPTPSNVAVALTQAQINQDSSSDLYLTQILDGVYSYGDPRTYPLSSYSYMIVPTSQADVRMNEAKGRTLGDFAYYFLCEGQQQAPALGYSPLPLNLVQAGFDQVKRIPWSDTTDKNPSTCNNPTFDSANPESNLLAETAPQPEACDQEGAGPCGIALPDTSAAPTTTAAPSVADPSAGGPPAPGSTAGGPPAPGPTGGGPPGPGPGPTAAGSTTGGPTNAGPTNAGPTSAAPGAATNQPGAATNQPGVAPSSGVGPQSQATDPGAVAPTQVVAVDQVPVQYYGTPTTLAEYRDARNSSTLGLLIALELLAFLVVPPILLRLWSQRRRGRT